jgi:peptidyl-prolyl cis-trans isomerase B (cyclophilin B)
MKSIYLACALSFIVGMTTAFADGTNSTPAAPPAKSSGDDVAVISTTDGTMVIAFWPKEAPNTVANFEKLARQGFYDGTCFHRIIKGFMVQGGDPLTKDPNQQDAWGTGGPGYSINAEFNDHSHQYGVISMARSSDPNSAGSQFFIVDGNASFLDHQYTAFGHLIRGNDVLDKIANTPVGPSNGGENSKPLSRVEVTSIKIVPADSIK